jgi:hypothetical protein
MLLLSRTSRSASQPLLAEPYRDWSYWQLVQRALHTQRRAAYRHAASRHAAMREACDAPCTTAAERSGKHLLPVSTRQVGLRRATFWTVSVIAFLRPNSCRQSGPRVASRYWLPLPVSRKTWHEGRTVLDVPIFDCSASMDRVRSGAVLTNGLLSSFLLNAAANGTTADSAGALCRERRADNGATSVGSVIRARWWFWHPPSRGASSVELQFPSRHQIPAAAQRGYTPRSPKPHGWLMTTAPTSSNSPKLPPPLGSRRSQAPTPDRRIPGNSESVVRLSQLRRAVASDKESHHARTRYPRLCSFCQQSD